jgi:hypothetical protein
MRRRLARQPGPGRALANSSSRRPKELQIQLTSDDRRTLWQVLEGYLDDILRKLARMNLFDERGDFPARETLPEVLRGRDRRASSGADVNAARH